MLKRILITVSLGLLTSNAAVPTVQNSYRTRLTTAAFEPPARSFKGDGAVVATITGDNVRVIGDFRALDAPAVRVRLLSGPIVGAAGGMIVATLALSANATTGTISGDLQLTPAQLTALREGRVYVQVETEAAPGGALWGWLMPNRPFPGEGVPEKQNWLVR